VANETQFDGNIWWQLIGKRQRLAFEIFAAVFASNRDNGIDLEPQRNLLCIAIGYGAYDQWQSGKRYSIFTVLTSKIFELFNAVTVCQQFE